MKNPIALGLIALAMSAATPAFGQRMKKEKLTVNYIQPPKIHLADGVGYTTTVVLDYKKAIDEEIAAAEAEYQQALEEYPALEAAAKAAHEERVAQYERELEEWNKNGTVGKIIETQILENSKPQPPAAYYPPSRPVRRTVQHAKLWDETQLASTYGRVEGLNPDPKGVQIEVHLFGYEHTEPVAERKEFVQYDSKTKAKSTYYKSYWSFDYRHNITIRAVDPSGRILFDDNPDAFSQYRHYESEQIKGTSPQTSRQSELDKMENRVVDDNMKTVQWIINDYLGTTEQARDIEIVVPNHKKLDYSDFESAMFDAKEGYLKLISAPEEARTLLAKAIAAWDAALAELDMDDKKARINAKVAPDLYSNLITACIFAGEFEAADSYYSQTLRLDFANRDANHLAELKLLLDDLVSRQK